jgi:hypothetical protein
VVKIKGISFILDINSLREKTGNCFREAGKPKSKTGIWEGRSSFAPVFAPISCR